jgi:hypothetical protein
LTRTIFGHKKEGGGFFVERKAFLIALMTGAPVIGCSRAAKLPDHETDSMLFTRDEVLRLMDAFIGIDWHDNSPMQTLSNREHLWRKLMNFTTPEIAKEFRDAYIDDFLNNLPFIQYKYFIEGGGDQTPEDMDRLKEMVKRSIR